MRAPSYHEYMGLKEYAQRQNTSLDMFRPLKHAEKIFTSQAKELLILGGNRAGKTLNAAVKCSALAMDVPVILEDGTLVNQRRRHQKDRCLTIWIVGYDQKHIGQTIYRILFRAKQGFRIIKDKDGSWRTWRRWEAGDAAREDETRLSPPLIPMRCVDQTSWSWENKANREFNSVAIINPITKERTAEIFCYTSRGKPKAGDPVDVIWIDESIEHEEDYAEWQARLVDRGGIIFWSSWPNTSNDALGKLHERCQADEGRDDPLHECVTLTMSGNATLSEKNKQDFLDSCATDEDRMARDMGLFITEQLRMYPLFDSTIHSAIVGDMDDYKTGDEISTILKKNDGIPPRDWMRELVLDPGTQHPAVLFIAVPPPHLGEYYVVYDELYPGRADADQVAIKLRDRTRNQRFHRFIIDSKAGVQTPMSFGMTVMDNYVRAFKEKGIVCDLTGHGFTMGCTDVGGRIMRLQHLMHVQPSGYPKFRVITHKCPFLIKQLVKYKKIKSTQSAMDDRPAKGQAIDLAVCSEYHAASNPVYSTPKSRIEDGGPGFVAYMKKFGGRRDRDVSPVRMGAMYTPS